jgi:hypothetical protein
MGSPTLICLLQIRFDELSLDRQSLQRMIVLESSKLVEPQFGVSWVPPLEVDSRGSPALQGEIRATIQDCTLSM